MSKPQPLAALALLGSLAGLGVSIYLTLNHYAQVPLVCNLSGFSCERVLTSPYATLPLFAWPTAAAGVLFFLSNSLLLALLAFPQATGVPSSRLFKVALAWAGLGLLFVLGLVYIEVVVIGAICLWCTAVHVLVVLGFLLLIYQRSSSPLA
jgi:uncharacterized membrane protein